MVARFGLVMMGFDGGHLGVGWVLRWRSGLRLGFWGWVTAWLEAVGAGLNLFGVSVVWIGLGLSWWCCGGTGFVVVALWLFATVISELTGQHRSSGSHRVRIFTTMPLSFLS